MTEPHEHNAPVLPSYQQMADAAAFMQHHAQTMHQSGQKVLADLKVIADQCREEEFNLEREHAERIERNRCRLNTVEGMIAFYMGVEQQPENPPMPLHRRGELVMLEPEKPRRFARLLRAVS